MTKTPNFFLENQTQVPKVAGVDEAGCGPWAGPVVAASVMFLEFDPEPWAAINDSKKLSPKKRQECFEQLIASNQITYGIGMSSVEEIDQLNIGKATRLAMERAISALPFEPEHALIDGIRAPNTTIPYTLVVKGDQLSLSIAAASIIAKVTRDKIMAELDRDYPGYYWAKNAGYGTAIHQQALKSHGVTPHHRKSFAPIKALLQDAA